MLWWKIDGRTTCGIHGSGVERATTVDGVRGEHAGVDAFEDGFHILNFGFRPICYTSRGGFTYRLFSAPTAQTTRRSQLVRRTGLAVY